jgi:hypothetical protein
MKAHENNVDSSESEQWFSTVSDSWTGKTAMGFPTVVRPTLHGTNNLNKSSCYLNIFMYDRTDFS